VPVPLLVNLCHPPTAVERVRVAVVVASGTWIHPDCPAENAATLWSNIIQAGAVPWAIASGNSCESNKDAQPRPRTNRRLQSLKPVCGRPFLSKGLLHRSGNHRPFKHLQRSKAKSVRPSAPVEPGSVTVGDEKSAYQLHRQASHL